MDAKDTHGVHGVQIPGLSNLLRQQQAAGKTSGFFFTHPACFVLVVEPGNHVPVAIRCGLKLSLYRVGNRLVDHLPGAQHRHIDTLSCIFFQLRAEEHIQ